MTDFESIMLKIRERFSRPVMSNPEGAVVHHGDCRVFDIQICTCGLLHDLQPLTDGSALDLYPAYHNEGARQHAAVERIMFPTDKE